MHQFAGSCMLCAVVWRDEIRSDMNMANWRHDSTRGKARKVVARIRVTRSHDDQLSLALRSGSGSRNVRAPFLFLPCVRLPP